MKLITFPEANEVIAKNQSHLYNPMPAHIAGDRSGTTIVCWKLTWQERLKVAFTGVIWHRMLTFDQKMQPQLLEVDKPFQSPLHKEHGWLRIRNIVRGICVL